METMKKLLLLLSATFVVGVVHAQEDYGRYYRHLPFDMPQVVVPVFPERTLTLSECGGLPGGLVSNTVAIRRVIEELASGGGGTLRIPAGIWLTGPVVLKDNIRLELERGALLKFSRNFEDYPLIVTTYGARSTVKALSNITGTRLTNIAIVGEGIIDGGGDAWRPVDRSKLTPGQWDALVASGGVTYEKKSGTVWFPTQGALDAYLKLNNNKPETLEVMTSAERKAYHAFFRSAMVKLTGCRNVLLQGVTFQNSPEWNLHPLLCENLTVDGVTVRNPWYSQNGDGIDIESCDRVLIVSSSFDVGDDAICVKSGVDEAGRRRGVPAKNLLVDGCTVYHGHGGFVVGSEMSGGVNRTVVRNCTFIGTDVGLRFKSQRGRGGVVENIWIENISMTDIPGEALLFDLYYKKRFSPGDSVPPVTEGTPVFRNLFVRNITGTGIGTAMLFNGLPEMKLQNVSVEEVSFEAEEGITVREAQNVTFRDVRLALPSGVRTVTVAGSTAVDTTGIHRVKF